MLAATRSLCPFRTPCYHSGIFGSLSMPAVTTGAESFFGALWLLSVLQMHETALSGERPRSHDRFPGFASLNRKAAPLDQLPTAKQSAASREGGWQGHRFQHTDFVNHVDSEVGHVKAWHSLKRQQTQRAFGRPGARLVLASLTGSGEYLTSC